MLKLQSLVVSYGNKEVLHDISFEVSPGEVLVVVGPNGSGKSTMIRAASGILPATAGNIYYGDRDLTSLSERERARLISVVPQATQLGGAFTVEQTVRLGRTASMGWLGVPSKRDRKLIDASLKQTDLVPFIDRRIADLSGGEQQRVLVARALAQDCPVMLLDEPTSHLDLQHQIHLLKLVRSLAVQKNLVVLITLHDLNMAALFADRVALLVSGKVKAIGKPQEVLTARNIKISYGIGVEVTTYPRDGRQLILPLID
ncbi:MAG: ABC transporter ATP-binding protein [Bacteroidota bacterium]